MAMRKLVVLLTQVMLVVSFWQNADVQYECTYKCNECPDTPFYSMVNGSCKATGVAFTEFGFGEYYCNTGNVIIHSNDTCHRLNVTLDTPSWSYGYLLKKWDVRLFWNNSHGCMAESNPPFWVGSPSLTAPVCLGVQRVLPPVLALIVGTLIGILLAAIGTFCQRNSLNDKFDQHVAHKEDFWPGAKKMAAEYKVGFLRRKLALLYRICQVVANAWLPMLLMIIFDTRVVMPLWLLLYLLPGFVNAGTYIFMQPEYVLSPPDVSLYGTDHVQPDTTCLYLFSAIRPLIMCGAVVLSRFLFGPLLESSTTFVFNTDGFFRIGLIRGFAPLVLDYVVIVTAIGSFMHMTMTAGLVCQKWGGGGPNETLSLVQDPELCAEVTHTAKQICDAAVDIDDDFPEDEIVEDAKQKIQDLGVKPLSARDVCIAILMMLVDLAAYIYKIVAFIRKERYILATIITISLSESFFVLLFNGNLKRAWASFRRAARDGVATIDFISCCQWDNGIAGVPYLMVTIYGLPLVSTPGLISSASSAFFMFTGTKAMAAFIQDTVDNDMFNAGITGDEEEMDIRRYFAEAQDESSEDEKMLEHAS